MPVLNDFNIWEDIIDDKTHNYATTSKTDPNVRTVT
jgi:hypothetical protein